MSALVTGLKAFLRSHLPGAPKAQKEEQGGSESIEMQAFNFGVNDFEAQSVGLSAGRPLSPSKPPVASAAPVACAGGVPLEGRGLKRRESVSSMTNSEYERLVDAITTGPW